MITLSSYAQTPIKLIVKDPAATSLEGVSIALQPRDAKSKIIGVTDREGVFTFSLESFPVTVVLTHVSFITYELLIDKPGEHIVQMIPSSITMEDVVITGQFEAQSLKKSVYQVRVIGPEVIRMRNATNVQSILNTELGIRYVNDPILGTANISLMGMSGQNVKILLDGVPLVERGETRESLNQIDVNTIERIEIVEGPMSVLYGSDALAGVINIITRKPEVSDNWFRIDARMLEESAGKQYKVFGNEGVHHQSVNGTWRGKRWNAGGGFTRNVFEGWDSDESTVRWLPKDQLLGNGSIGFQTDNITTWYRLNYLNEVIFTPGTPVNNQVTNKEYITNRFTHQAQADWKLSDRWLLNAVTSYQDYSRRTRSIKKDLLTGKETLSLEAGSQDEANFTSFSFRGNSVNKFSHAFSLQTGIDINVNEGSGERIDRERSIGDYALFTSAEIQALDKLSIRPGLRFIYNTAYDAPPVVPSLNIKYVLTNTLDLRAAYGYGFRAPALRELYFNFFDANHSIQGNTNLKAEYSNSFSLALNNRASLSSTVGLNTMLQGYYNSFENMIALGIDAANPTVSTYINIDHNRTAGGVFNNTLTWKGLTALVGVSYIGVYNRLSEDDGSLPELLWTPEVNSNLIYNFSKLGASVSFFYKFTGERNNYQTVSVEGETQIQLASVEHFHWADVAVSKRLNKYLELTAGVKNLFDVTTLQNTSSDTGGAHSVGGPVPMSYGRSYFFGLNIQWSK